MDSAVTTMVYIAITSVVVLSATFLLFQPTGFVKWLQKKNYQYEVTFALYMLTPTEKFIFNSVLFLTLSMLLLASILYLPAHVVTMSKRAYYYCAGDAALMASSRQAAETLYGTASRAGDAIMDVTTAWWNKSAPAAATAAQTAAAAADGVREGLP